MESLPYRRESVMTANRSGRNLLGEETSPYLLQHKDNPVHWMSWGEEAFALARAENKPILLSIGYAACHWCHVMAHESFEDPDTAALMNELFVNIKVDREERPDLDQIYQQALALLGQQGGWPLTMFLTPEGEPFWGGTYFPPRPAHGRPGFPDVLRGIASAYHREPEKVAQNTAALLDGLARLAENRPAGQIAPSLIDEVAGRLAGEVDPTYGGIGSAPKFPQPGIMELLWRAWIRTGRPQFRTAVTTTLTRMCQGGIYDHLGGGFARYSTDERWLVPHFEKMLYDNAQLLGLLSLVWQGTGDPLYAERAGETVAWLQREMIALDAEGRPTGAFAAAIDADSEGEEGRFYVWSEEEIDRLLGDDARLFKEVYGVTPGGNWEGRTILNRSGDMALRDAGTEAELARLRRILWEEREKRIRPGWDDKVLADWNGLTIEALANAGFALGEPGWISAASTAFDFVCRELDAGEGRLFHSWRHGRARHPANVDDYANMARGGLALYEVTGDRRFLDKVRLWTGVLDRHYWDAERGGYFFSAEDAERLVVRAKNASDSAVPSGNGSMVGVSARLYHLTGETVWRDRAEAIVAAFSGEFGRNFFPLSTLVNGAELLEMGRQIVIIGQPGEPDREALLDVVRKACIPNRVLTLVPPGSALPASHPAHGKSQREGRATVYLCEAMTCSAPITWAADLATALEG
jgi:uncharacterized protein YyaL (SSP411 family)